MQKNVNRYYSNPYDYNNNRSSILNDNTNKNDEEAAKNVPVSFGDVQNILKYQNSKA